MFRPILTSFLLGTMAFSASADVKKKSKSTSNRILSCTRKIIQKKVNGDDGIIKSAELLTRLAGAVARDEELKPILKNCRDYLAAHPRQGKFTGKEHVNVTKVLSTSTLYKNPYYRYILASQFGSKTYDEARCKWGSLNASAAILLGLSAGLDTAVCTRSDMRKTRLIHLQGGFTLGVGAFVTWANQDKNNNGDFAANDSLGTSISVNWGLGPAVVSDIEEWDDIFGGGVGAGALLNLGYSVRVLRFPFRNDFSAADPHLCISSAPAAEHTIRVKDVGGFGGTMQDLDNKAYTACSGFAQRISDYIRDVEEPIYVHATFRCEEKCLGR